MFKYFEQKVSIINLSIYDLYIGDSPNRKIPNFFKILAKFSNVNRL